jgi:arabinofuranan 3-O-arabinosyltransferase
VRGAQRGVPFWLVLGESSSSGWRATVDRGDPTSSQLVNGYANGWLVVPPASNFGISLEWVPQRTVWVALGISAATLVLCLVLACWRRRRANRRRDARGNGGPDAREPELASPLVSPGTGVTWRAALVTAAAGGFVSAVVAPWWIGAVVALCIAAAMVRPRLRPLLTLGAPLCVLLTASYVVVQQVRHDYAYGYLWVEHFARVADVAWLAVLLLAADALVEVVRTRGTRAGARHPAT